jgi:hypothetical protein
MKAAIIVIAGIMATAGPVLAEQPKNVEYITYKIKIDKDEDFEKLLEENEGLLKQLDNKNLFTNWTKKETDIPQDAAESFKKPSFDDNVEENKEETDYIKCGKITTTK